MKTMMPRRKRRALKDIRTEAVITLKNDRDNKYGRYFPPAALPHLHPAILGEYY